MLIPCNTKNSAYYLEDRVYENCNEDQAKLLEYLKGMPNMIIYQNVGRFIIDEYGDSSIKRESALKIIRSNGENQWIDSLV